MLTIEYYFEDKAIDPIRINNVQAGYTLLDVALDSGVYINHRCGLGASCTTCQLFVADGGDLIETMGARENEFLDQTPNRKPESRLGCQTKIIAGSGKIKVIVPDQSVIDQE